MQERESQSKWYNLRGYAIQIKCNDRSWLESVSRFLRMSAALATTPHLSLDLRLIDADEADHLLPLPDLGWRIPEVTLLLNRPVVVKSYLGESEQWSDYEGYARTYVDYEHGVARVLLFRDHDIIPHYADLLFAYNLINQLMVRYEFFSVHASCVELAGAGIMLSGNSGRGKSTSIFALLQQGFKVLSDERVLLYRSEQGFRGYSISDVIKVREGARERFFPALQKKYAYASIDDEHYYKCETIVPGGWTADTVIQHFLVINQSGVPQSRLSRINPARVVGEFFPVTMKAYENKAAAAKKFHFLMDFLSSIPCYQLDFGTDMRYFAALLKALTEGQAP